MAGGRCGDWTGRGGGRDHRRGVPVVEEKTTQTRGWRTHAAQVHGDRRQQRKQGLDSTCRPAGEKREKRERQSEEKEERKRFGKKTQGAARRGFYSHAVSLKEQLELRKAFEERGKRFIWEGFDRVLSSNFRPLRKELDIGSDTDMTQSSMEDINKTICDHRSSDQKHFQVNHQQPRMLGEISTASRVHTLPVTEKKL